jgi:hypothetical protein
VGEALVWKEWRECREEGRESDIGMLGRAHVQKGAWGVRVADTHRTKTQSNDDDNEDIEQ